MKRYQLLLLILFSGISLPLQASADKARFIKNLEAGQEQTVVAFGTSLTKVGAWVDQVSTALEQSYPGLCTVVNGARGGANSDWGCSALDANVLAHDPDTVLIEFSVNDAVAQRQTSVAHARGNLDNMIERIMVANPECEIILQVMNPAVGVCLRHRPNLDAYNQMYRDAAKEHGLRLIDHYPAWDKILNEAPGRFLRYVPDAIHPVRQGALAVSTPVVLQAVGAPVAAPEQNRDTPCWRYLLRSRIDSNKDREVTREEFHQFWRDHFDQQDADQNGELVVAEYGPAVLFAYIDRDQDQRINPTEYLAVYSGIFDEFDLNGDERLCREEH